MKNKVIISLLLWLGALATGLAQQPAKVFPGFITVHDSNALLIKTNLFQRIYQTKSTDELRLLRTKTDHLGMKREKFQQYYKGVPVDGATVTVHTNKSGQATLLNGMFVGLPEINVDPAISAEQARAAATTHVGAKQYKWEDQKEEALLKKMTNNPEATYYPKGELVIAEENTDDKSKGRFFTLAWKFDIYEMAGELDQRVYVNAATGNVLKTYPLVIHCDPGTASTTWNRLQTIHTDHDGTSYILYDDCPGHATISTVEDGSLAEYRDYDNIWDSVGQTGPATSHYYGRETIDYYDAVHGRNSYNDAGSGIQLRHKLNYGNASWHGSGIIKLGSHADDAKYYNTLDVVAHEFTHGVVSAEAGLVYQGESGALNESFADIFGETCERWSEGHVNIDWLHREDYYRGNNRSFINPNDRNHPDTYMGTHWKNTCVGCPDAGGVHSNSGVQNHWFYLLTEGGSGTNDNGDVFCVNGIGIGKADSIAYWNLAEYLWADANYADARAGAIEAAQHLYGMGSEEEIAVTNAWYAVGVGAAYNFPPKITCPPSVPAQPNDPGLCSAVVTYPDPVAEANCPVVAQIDGLPSGAAFPVGVTTNRFRVTDAIGGSYDECAFTVTVNDVEDPTIECHANIIVVNDKGICGAKVVFGLPKVKDNCTPIAVFCNPASGTIFPIGTTLVLCKAVDIGGNTDDCTFSVTVTDKEPPSIKCPPNHPDWSCEKPTDPAATGEPVVTDNCLVRTVWHMDAIVPGICPNTFTINRTWHVVDIYGNSNSCMQTINVKDKKAPVISCPPNTTVVCNISPDSTGYATAVDNCDPNPALKYTDRTVSGDCDWLCTIERKWTAMDNCGNTATCTQRIVRNPLPLLEEALRKDLDGDGVTDTLVLGVSNSTLTIPPGRGKCIQKWLPGTTNLASGLKFRKEVVGTDCRPGTNPVQPDGSLSNRLLAEALYLNIMVRLDPTLGTTKLNRLSCSIDPVIIHYLASNPDINELLRFSNTALGNVAGQPHLNQLLDALKCINGPLKLCDLNVLTPAM